MKLTPVLLASAQAASYLHGKSNGDSVHALDGSGQTKIPLASNADIFGVSTDILWFQNNGAISFESTTDSSPDSVARNLVVASLWGTSGSDALSQGCKFTHLNFTLGESGVKVNTFHPTPPHLNFFKMYFHLTSPKSEI